MTKPTRNLTIKDIATLSGVGKSTVSRVLNHDPNVKPATREKIESIIEQYDFVPSKSARAMRGVEYKVIGIIVSRLDSTAENQAVRAMLPIFYQNGFDPIIVESQFDSKLVKEQLNMLASRHADGIILFAFSGLDLQLLEKWQNKLIIVARDLPGYYSVSYDDTGAVKQLLDYLYYQKQHQRIAFLGINKYDTTTGLLRYQAYEDFCQQHHIESNYRLGELNYLSGYQLAKDLIAQKPTAIVCATDTLALGLYKYLREHLINNIEVTSIGNSEFFHFLFPETLSVDLGFQQGGKTAAQLLVRLLNRDPTVSSVIITSKLPLTN